MALLLTKSNKIKQRMSRKGYFWDNSVAESFFKTLKYECTNRYDFKTILQTHKVIVGYIQWYNYIKIHSSPDEKELEIRKNM